MSLPTAFISVILIWSTTPLAVKWSALGSSSTFAVFSRMAIGTALCWLLLKALRIPFPMHRKARQTYLAGGLSLFTAMSLTYWSSQFIDSGMIAVLFGLSPMITGLGAAYWLEEQALAPAKVAGMLFGVAGLWIVFRTSVALGPSALEGMGVLLAGVIAQSLGMVWIKRIGDDNSPVAMNLGALLVALPLFFAAWLVADGHVPESVFNRAGAAILYLSVFGSVMGFVLYYYMIKHLQAGTVALITLVTPVLALLLGHGLNGETVQPSTWAGTACIAVGLSLHQWGGRLLRLAIARR
jgi:drug/metabolite transporter (DMT)-like permease